MAHGSTHLIHKHFPLSDSSSSGVPHLFAVMTLAVAKAIIGGCETSQRIHIYIYTPSSLKICVNYITRYRPYDILATLHLSLNPLKPYQRAILCLHAKVSSHMCHNSTRVHPKLDPDAPLYYFWHVLEEGEGKPEVTRLVPQVASQGQLALWAPGHPQPAGPGFRRCRRTGGGGSVVAVHGDEDVPVCRVAELAGVVCQRH